MNENAALLLRAVALYASFVGLCAGLRVLLKLNRFAAPFVAASSIIVLLMLAGMLNALAPAFYALYALGFCGLGFAYVLRRERPQFGLILAGLVFCAYLGWRYYPCVLWSNDDLSHWGLVARLLLRYDRFPNGGDSAVFFQSYPLGSACFIYYVCKTLGNVEGLYLAAQNFLLGALFLPVFGCAEKHRRLGDAIALGAFALLFHLFRDMGDLKVDLCLAFFGIGITACIACNSRDLKRALICALPGIAAVVFIKNSGLFFALLGAAGLMRAVRAGKEPRKRQWGVFFLALGVAAGAYLLWMAHIRWRFPSALETKHAVSLAAYASEFRAKRDIIFQIVGAVLHALLKIGGTQLKALALGVCCAGFVLAAHAKEADLRGGIRRAARRAGVCAGVYAVWLVLVVLMYIFSMPEVEALLAAGFSRYNGTGIALAMGLAVVFLLRDLEGLALRTRALKLAAASAALACAAFYLFGAFAPPLREFHSFKRHTELSPARAALEEARASVPDGGRYLFYVSTPETDYSAVTDDPLSFLYDAHWQYYLIKYTVESNDLLFIVGSMDGFSTTRDCRAFIEENIEACDAFLILDPVSGAFAKQSAAFFEDYRGHTPVLHVPGL